MHQDSKHHDEIVIKQNSPLTLTMGRSPSKVLAMGGREPELERECTRSAATQLRPNTCPASPARPAHPFSFASRNREADHGQVSSQKVKEKDE